MTSIIAVVLFSMTLREIRLAICPTLPSGSLGETTKDCERRSKFENVSWRAMARLTSCLEFLVLPLEIYSVSNRSGIQGDLRTVLPNYGSCLCQW